MRWFLYNLLFGVGFVLMLPRFLWRMKRRGGYGQDFAQRFGRYAPEVRAKLEGGGRIWIHAVSVGELFVALKVMERLRAERPDARFVVSVTTSTGAAIARERVLAPDVLIYFPLDFPPIVKRVLDTIQPAMLILVEGEFWPNLIRAAHARNIPLFLVNGRLSQSSFRGYRKVRVFTRHIFPRFDRMYVQSAGDRERLIDLGAPPDLVEVVNSAKYEVAEADPAGQARARALLRAAGIGEKQPMLLGGSTWPGEEDALLQVWLELKDRFSDLALVLAPRHAERRQEVVDAAARYGVPYVLRSGLDEGAPAGEPGRVLILDSTGELMCFYAAATVIFVGKSLTQHGGQNVIEPALFGKPILVGPNMENFPVVMEDFRAADAIREIRDPEGLKAAVAGLLDDPAAAAALGERAARLVREKSGGVRETVAGILGRMGPD